MVTREKIDLMKRALLGDAEATKILGPMYEHQTKENGAMIPGLSQAIKELENESR